jgi:phosphoesterase RecJ-like protein
MDGIGEARRSIMRASRIAIAGHINPDGDSIGSLLSLGLGLERLGKKVYFISEDGVPQRYKTLPGAGRIVGSVNKPADLAISVDCSNREILGNTYNYFRKATSILEIDHHDFRRPFGDAGYIDNKAAAVGEMIYLLLKSLKVTITKEIAQNLMTSIVVETDSFRLPGVRSFTFELCAELVDKGVDVYRLVDTVFWSKRKESAILSGMCLTRCKFLRGGKVAWSIITKKDFDKIGGKEEDVDAVPDDMRAIKNVRISVFFRENGGDKLRVSLRSKDGINVASLAERHGGGGHFDVAGCSIANNSRAVKKFLIETEKLI